ncbi:MAG: error-prone DNA polymerase [Oceanospirillaceae bacterium]|uniref:error-prone DNA polymerase n=3 Tax=unclassified Thalassolituus TaxID=2624967 RepID=UPI000C3E8844|nr:error-prone DNA polymerase [Thalassolituus sp. UBA6592]MAS26504.1 error-prone DNA polymerase [Oceanospirillaceae bacterium]MBL34266.1 error-prone DNA polymerase [Oceanospirillaceae bacterium]MBS52782.1 error-prone DNA polymerase [Oceanospirillaceae bacterium]
MNHSADNTADTNIATGTPVAYAELHCVSNFSFLRGASHPQELVQQAVALGYQGLAITDECSLAGVVRAWQALQDLQQETQKDPSLAAKLENFRLIIGSEFHCDDHIFVVLVTDKKAYSELCRLITTCRRAAEKGTYLFNPGQLFDLQHCLLLWQPQQSFYAQPQQSQQPQQTQQAEFTRRLSHHFAHRLWLLAERMLDATDEWRFDRLCRFARQWQIPLTCASQVHMHIPARQPLQDCITAIRHNQTIESCRQHLFSNNERHLRSCKKLTHLYSAELMASTTAIARQCNFQLDEICYQYPTDTLPTGKRAGDYLRELTEAGCKKRFPQGESQKVRDTIEKELTLIAEKEYEHYFLTIYDIVRFARSQNILCQGRGSAANSVVCYCLEITEVNPAEVNLLFERFISAERHEPPDIDVDFESQRREEVIQYIYQKYGRERAALAATVISYRPKSALRDVASALGMDLLALEPVLANFGYRYKKETWLDELADRRVADGLKLRQLKYLVSEILRFPRHLSQHVGGFVIAREKLTDLVPVENAAMDERTVIQWDKEDLETLGLMKVDILSLGMLSAIRRCLQQLNITLADIPRDDPATYQMLQKADSIGVFQVESRAQMNMLPRLKPRNYYDLVIQVSIVRPGPIHGDMVHPYLRRRNGEEEPDYPMDALRPILERTLGIPLFQEQVIAFAMVAADFTAAEADLLRRSMASWRKKGHMQKLQQRLEINMLNNGFSLDYIQRLQRQLLGFGEYGFPESHAASFALLVYASAWLKCHHPALFCAAILNSQPMGFYSPAQLINDARAHGVNVLPVSVEHSDWLHHADPGDQQPHLRLGLRLIHGFSEDSAERLVTARQQRPFADIQDCRLRAELSQKDGNLLASANAFSGLAGNRYNSRYQSRWSVSEPVQADLLADAMTDHQWQADSLAALNTPDETEDMLEDYQTLGLTLGRHPMAILREQGMLGNSLSAAELLQRQHNDEGFVCGLVTCRQRPGTAAGVTFVTLEDESGCVNLVVWLSTAERQLKALTQSRILQAYGRIEKDSASGITHVIAYRLADMSSLLDNLKTTSHNYH